MTNLVSVKTNFTSGQVSPELFGRGDLKIFENGARCLENMLIHPTGGISRRPGTIFIDNFPGKARIIPFEFNTEQVYLVCICEGKVRVYKNDKMLAEMDSPWGEEHLDRLCWTQSADTLLIVHPDVAPRQISRNQNEVWKIEEWDYYKKDGMVYCPYYNFFRHKENISVSGNSGNVTVNAVNEIFDEKYIGSHIKIYGGLIKITGFNNTRQLSGTVVKNLSSGASTTDWEEEAFSPRRGYPVSITFHQDRMVIGGSRSLPNRLWLSKSSDLFNFDLGKGLDDEAIEFAILSDQVNGIRAVVSSRHLLVFTTGAEWMVSGDPLTPETIQLRRQTSIGSYGHCTVHPQQIDGATVFVSNNGKQLREFLYADVEQAYQAKDLTLLASEVVDRPVDSVFNPNENILYLILEDGTASCLTSYRTEEVTAWSKLRTDGKYLSGGFVGNDMYFCIERRGKYYLEKVSSEVYSDCAIKLSSETPQKIWEGLEHLEGSEVAVIADGFSVKSNLVVDGKIELLDEALEVLAGLPYEHVVEPLPFMVDALRPYSPRGMRIVNAKFRLLQTREFCVNLGNGYFQVPLKRVHKDEILDSPPGYYSGDIILRALGWVRDMDKPMWSIKSSEPLEFNLLSAVLEIKIKG